MKNEEKDLLIKDLCARLPYGVKFPWRYLDIDDEGQDEEVNVIADVKNIGTDGMIECGYKEVESDFCHISKIKPYLRPMSSMTEEERNEFDDYTFEVISFFGQAAEAGQLTDWLNAHHFDYRGLIEMSLAIEAPEGMYNN